MPPFKNSCAEDYMKRVARMILSALVLLMAASTFARPVDKEKRHGRPNYDVRSNQAVRNRALELAANPPAAVRALQSTLGAQGYVALDGLTGTPRIAARLDGFLTGPSKQS